MKHEFDYGNRPTLDDLNNAHKTALTQFKKYTDPCDPEREHANKDRILTELLTSLGFTKVVEEYWKGEKWYA